MYKLVTSAEDTDDLPIGSDRDSKRRQQELTNYKCINGKYLLRIMLKDAFGFSDNQQKATYGLGYNLKLTREKNDTLLNKVQAIADARFKFDHIHCYVPHYTPSIPQQGVLSKKIFK